MENTSRDGGFFPEKEDKKKELKEDESILLPVLPGKRCKYCLQIPLDDEIEKTFGIPVCRSCRYSSLKFVTKTSCLSDYLLVDDELKELRFLERPNPRKGTWSRMHLYLKEEVEEFAVWKWGSLEKIEEIKEKRKKRTKDRKQRKLKKNIKDLRRKTRMEVGDTKKHEHVFEDDGEVCRCRCGMSVEQEEL
ncbi:DNA repair protein RAD14 [Encephalitozoon intestinalis]